MDNTVKQRLNQIEDELNSVKQKNKTKIVENHSEIEDLQKDIERIQTQLEEVSDIQSQLTNSEPAETTDEIEDCQQKLTLLAQNIIQLRSTLNETSNSVKKLQDQVTIHFKILQNNISSLICNACENTVDSTELDTLQCPHCKQQFTDIEVTNRFLRSNIGTLHKVRQNDHDFSHG